MTTAFVILTLPHTLPADNRHFPIPFWVSASVIGRDILIVTVALAIFIMTDFRGFKPSLLGKISTAMQILAVGIVLIAAVIPAYSGYYLPTIYFLVTPLSFSFRNSLRLLRRKADAERRQNAVMCRPSPKT